MAGLFDNEALLDLDGLPARAALFAEDFEFPPEQELPPEPEVIEPTFSAAELADARTEAWQAGHAAALAEAASADHAVIRQTITAIATQLSEARESASRIVSESVDAVARLLLDTLALAFPDLCSHHGAAELSAVIAKVLPAIAQEPAITVRMNPRHAATVARDIERIDPDLGDRVRIIAIETVLPGDVRITWRNGSAVRNAAELWEQICEVLGVAGLLGTAATVEEQVEYAG